MKQILFSLLAVVLLSSCGSLKKGERYASLYNEMPNTLLVMPPVNTTEDVEAKDLLYYSITRPLGECGYYVIPPQLGMEVLKTESAYDAEEFIDKPLNKFYDLFGADAVVFAEIKKWKKNSALSHKLKAEVRYIIKSTKTNEILFDRECKTKIDMSVDTGLSDHFPLIGSLFDWIFSIFNTATTDNVVAARLADYYIFRDMPRGKYSPTHLQDKDAKSEKPKVTSKIKLNEIDPYAIQRMGGGYTKEQAVQPAQK